MWRRQSPLGGHRQDQGRGDGPRGWGKEFAKTSKERDKWESKAEVSLQVLSSQSWNSSLYAVMRGEEGLSPGRGVGMMSKGLFEEDLLCSPRTTDEPAETDEAGKSGRMLL